MVGAPPIGSPLRSCPVAAPYNTGMNTLSDQCVLITGGGSGIGLAAARVFLAEGARVAIAGRDADKLRRAAEALRRRRPAHSPRRRRDRPGTGPPAGGGRDEALRPDRHSRQQRRAEHQGAHLPRTDAGALDGCCWPATWKGRFTACRRCCRRCASGGTGSSSTSTRSPASAPTRSAASATSRPSSACAAWRWAWPPRRSRNGVRVSSIYPGEVDTPILEQRPSPLSEEHRRTMLQPEDVAAAMLFIAKLPATRHGAGTGHHALGGAVHLTGAEIRFAAARKASRD